jgi:hypothetical protein
MALSFCWRLDCKLRTLFACGDRLLPSFETWRYLSSCCVLSIRGMDSSVGCVDNFLLVVRARIEKEYGPNLIPVRQEVSSDEKISGKVENLWRLMRQSLRRAAKDSVHRYYFEDD